MNHIRSARTILVLSTIALSCSSSCLAMFQQQSIGSSHIQNAEGALTAAAIPTIKSAIPLNPAPPVAITPAATSPIIVIGFLGGHVKRTNIVHNEVQLAMRLRQQHPIGVYAEVFANSHSEAAFRQIQQLLDVNHDGVLSLAEKQHARIIIYGHSWGASEAVTMAHQLEHSGIPILLTVLVDMVPKIGESDERIPSNVAQAINFYQSDGLLHGRSTILAEDPARTQILGNFQFDYKDNHVSCDQYPWYARLFMGPHIEIENDPRVWDRVESLIAAKLPPKN